MAAAAAQVVLVDQVEGASLQRQQAIDQIQMMSNAGAQPLTLAQMKAEVEADTETSGFLGTIGDAFKRLISSLFTSTPAAAPSPNNEYMGCEVNLLSANKNQEGKGAAGGSGGGGGTDAWLGNMPGLKQFGSIFNAQTGTETESKEDATAAANGLESP
eukprot:CAMPEP_0185577766 /NCGR_PEP_ID=MMETSP0434-20130131/10968_1 /TAXON_ID=626734 ORGANISM="Favella taraikaensis, Strain Fe Narragansett Bay" /NCGR_SAMPLE_ID=MMETSP0434 /ASSEMBLY_ACC=CAM_ASM_000379 /LENGTH=157 /DNA_ID=CAMNT_0028195421 /DNA_START=12 /DNA_END=485 /DNA_ORIENTATION=-